MLSTGGGLPLAGGVHLWWGVLWGGLGPTGGGGSHRGEGAGDISVQLPYTALPLVLRPKGTLYNHHTAPRALTSTTDVQKQRTYLHVFEPPSHAARECSLRRRMRQEHIA